MNKVTIFKYEENKPVRIMNINGEPWFVLKDVCEVLGMDSTQLKKVADRLEEDEKGRTQITTPGGAQESWIISESGLYNVILRSDKPEAKPFRKWVTAVVLPSIRKNGGYIAGQEELSPQELMAKALLVARNLLTNFRETAKELGIKEKDFVGWLLEHKYIYRDQKNKLMPYAAKNNGLFEVKERTGRHNDWAGTQTLITPKGRETFRLLCKEPPVLPQFTAL